MKTLECICFISEFTLYSSIYSVRLFVLGYGIRHILFLFILLKAVLGSINDFFSFRFLYVDLKGHCPPSSISFTYFLSSSSIVVFSCRRGFNVISCLLYENNSKVHPCFWYWFSLEGMLLVVALQPYSFYHFSFCFVSVTWIYYFSFLYFFF